MDEDKKTANKSATRYEIVVRSELSDHFAPEFDGTDHEGRQRADRRGQDTPAVPAKMSAAGTRGARSPPLS